MTPRVSERPSCRHLNGTLETVDLDAILPWALNPPGRTEDSAGLRDLRQSLTTYGQALPVVVIGEPGGPYKLIDGHRRVAAARLLGWSAVWALVYLHDWPGVVAEMAAVLNLERQHYGLGEYLEGVRQGVVSVDLLLHQLPPRHRKVIERWAAAVPPSEIAPLLTVLRTPYAIDQARAAVRYLGWPKERQVEVLRWMGQQGSGSVAQLRHLLRAGVPPQRLAVAIEHGQGLW